MFDLEYGLVPKVQGMVASVFETVPLLIIQGVDGRGDHIDGDALAQVKGDQFLQEVPAVHDGHVDVQEDHLGDGPTGHGPIGQGIEGLFAVLENLDVIAVDHGFEHFSNAENGYGIVIHNEYAVYFLHVSNYWLSDPSSMKYTLKVVP